MRNIKIIGLAGPKGVGKSTVAKQLSEKLEAEFKTVQVRSFADPIRDAARAIGFSSKQLSDPVTKEVKDPTLGISPRAFMQGLGFMRLHNESVYVDIMRQRLALEQPFDEILYVVIDDVRFDNEAKWINENGGKVFELVRRGVDYTYEHASEHPIDADLPCGPVLNHCADKAADSILSSI